MVIFSNPAFLDQLENFGYYNLPFSRVLKEVSKVSHNIKSMKFCKIINQDEEIIELIGAQNNLEHIILDFCNVSPIKIIKALESNKLFKTFKLLHSRIDDNTCLGVLGKCNNLEEIELHNITFNSNFELPIEENLHLQKLTIDHPKFNSEANNSIILTLIMNFGKYLKELVFIVFLDDYSKNTIQIIANYYQNLVFLSIKINNREEFNELINFLDYFQKLKVLKINSIQEIEIIEMNLICNLLDVLPNTTYSLNIGGDSFKIAKDYVANFTRETNSYHVEIEKLNLHFIF